MIPQVNPKNKCDSFITVILHLNPVAINWNKIEVTEKDDFKFKKMTSSWRVMSFFFIVFVLPTLLISIPLYARYHLYPTLHFWATDGDVISLHNTVSSFWCQGQKVTVNGSFEAFQIRDAVTSHSRDARNIPLETTLFLNHDEAEEWGFYLVKGSKITFSACARWPGGSLVVVKGKENLRKCFYHEDNLSEELREPNHVANLAQPINGGQISDPQSNPLVNYPENHGGGEISDDSDPSLVVSEIAANIFAGKAKFNGDDAKLSEIPSANNPLRSIEKIKTKDRTLNDLPAARVAKITTFGLFSFNESLEVFAGNSSISSSEEYLRQCITTLASIELTPYRDCRERVDVSRSSDIRWKFSINESDFYYFIFASDNSIEANVINFNLHLHKIVYNTTQATSRCIDSKECFFSFPFLASTGVILDVKGNYNLAKNLADLNNYEVLSVCQPRFIVYTVLIILVPFIIVLFAFR